jgi:hypothetical protein
MSNSRSLFSLGLLLLFFCLPVLSSSSQSLKVNPQAQKLQFDRRMLVLAFDLLRERGVAFDPDLAR